MGRLDAVTAFTGCIGKVTPAIFGADTEGR
jgi:hypothetical protein